MKLGVHIGYWGLGLTRGGAARRSCRRRSGSATTRSGPRRPTAPTRRRSSAGSRRRPTTIRLGSAIFQMPGRTRGDDRDDRGDARPALGRADAPRHRLLAGRRSPRAGTASASAASSSARASTSRSCGWRSRASASSSTARRSTLPLPDGPGKALKLTIAPVQERIPIYLAAIGPKNTTLAAEIADGWIPTLFSPEHVAEFRPLLEEGFAARRRRQGLRRLRHRPDGQRDRHRRPRRRRATRCATTSRCTSAAWARASRTSTTRSSQRYGFEDAAREVQDLYLEGKKDEAAAALPGELIDTVSLCGPRRRGARAARRVTATPGVGTLMVVADGVDARGPRSSSSRLVAELALEGPPRRVRRPGPRVPDARARRGAGRARARGRAADLAALAASTRSAAGMHVRGGAGVPGVPHARAAAEALRGGGAGGARRRGR